MKLLLKSLIRYLVHQTWSTLSLMLGVTLAIASVVAVHLISDRIQTQMRGANAGARLGLTHAIEAPQLPESRYFEVRARWRRGEWPAIQSLVPMVEGDVWHDKTAYHLIGFDIIGAPVSGGDIATTAKLLTKTVVIAHRTSGLQVGQELTFIPNGKSVRVVGLYGETEADGQAHWLIADIATAQEVLTQRGQLTRIGVALAQTNHWRSWLDKLFPGIGSQFTPDTALIIADDLTLKPLASGNVEQRFTHAILFNIGTLSMLSAVVAMFLMYQSGVSSLRRRALLFVRLRGIGYTDRMLLTYVLIEGALLCGVASVIGIGLGLLLGEWLITLTHGGADAFATVTAASTLTPWIVGKGLGFGLGIGVTSMGLAYRAVRPEHDRRQPRSWWLSTGLLIAIVIVALRVGSDGLVGPFIALGALCFLATLCVRPVALGLSRLLIDRRSQRGRSQTVTVLINMRELQRYVGDVQVALSALLIAVATAIGIGVMVDSFRTSFIEMLTLRLEGDWFLQKESGFDRTDLNMMRAHHTVKTLHTYGEQTTWITYQNQRERIAVGYYELDDAVRKRYGFVGSMTNGDVFVSEPMARLFSLSIGDRFRIDTADTSTSVRVVHIFRDYGRASPRILMDHTVVQGLFGRAPVDRAFMTTTQSDDRPTVPALATERGWQIQSQAGMHTLALTVFDRTFAVTNALTAVGLIVAVMGLYNAITALQLKRDREFQLLQAIGFTAGDLMRMSVVQSLWLAGIALVLALPLGLGIAWMLCHQINPRAFGWSIPLRPGLAAIAPPLLFGFAIAPFAGGLPAVRWVFQSRHGKGQNGMRQYDE